MRVLLTGWPSFERGEATAGDVLSMRAVSGVLDGAGIPYDSAWSPAFHPAALHLDEADPGDYTHVVFTCGPAYGEQLCYLHRRYARCRRVAVGVSTIDPDDPAVTGFDTVLARDGDTGSPRRDLAAVPEVASVPVVGIILAPGQSEYGSRRRHAEVTGRLTAWLAGQDYARVPLDTRLDTRDWRHCATSDQFTAILRRLDLVVTTRLHGLVLALRYGVPAVAIDPVAGGGKVSAQARVWSWPAVVGISGDGGGDELEAGLRRCADWCLSPAGRASARRCAVAGQPAGPLPADQLLAELLVALGVREGR